MNTTSHCNGSAKLEYFVFRVFPGFGEFIQKDMTFYENRATKQGLPPKIDSDLGKL